MTKKFNKLIILCKANSVTGGSELVHQLCHELSTINLQAYICYYPFGENHSIPEEYSIYNIEQCSMEDNVDNLIILPEVATKYARKIINSQIGIWWLSIDNYYRKKGDSFLKDSLKYYKDLLRLRLIPLALMRKYLHFSQSYYAYMYLKKHNIDSEYLSDYLNPVHFEHIKKNKKNIILYNPVKGAKTTQRLIANNAEFKFIPLEKLNSKEVQNLFNESKLYIDFGNHPGKDRMPREAVMADCCLITGKRGSAENNVDIPIPEQYKFDDRKDLDNDLFKKTVNDLFSNYDITIKDFYSYKEIIKKEKENFQKQAYEIFTKLINVK